MNVAAAIVRVLSIVFFVNSHFPLQAVAADAPGAPGLPSTWATANKEILGTSLSNTSHVYFTGGNGVLTEVFYPTLDRVQNVDLQFLITDAAHSWGHEEKRQKIHEVSLLDARALAWKVVTTGDNGEWRITKRIFTDPSRDSFIVRVQFDVLKPGKKVKDYNVYILNNPAINNSGGGSGNSTGADNSRTVKKGSRVFLVASEPTSTASALGASIPWKKTNGKLMVSNGFVGQNDGYTDLFGGSADKQMTWSFDGAYGGNVAQIGWLALGATNSKQSSFDLVLSFGRDESEAMSVATATLGSNLNNIEAAYINEWKTYTNGLDSQNGMADNQYYLAAMILKTSQDKINGAMVAGIGTPWGETNGDSNQGGYHLVWARDLFKFASALIAAGDKVSANKAVEYLFNVQMQPDGHFPQNSYVDGRPYWNATQMDEIAMPIILAWKLQRTDLWPKIQLAAKYLVDHGPATEQDRWEEMSGYSPSTIAAEIAGLVCAADLAKSANDTAGADLYLKKADEWRNNVANWTFTTTGFHGNKKYYVRITANSDPNDDVILSYKNQAGSHGEKYIIDGGFLELVRMGVMSPSDWTIRETIEEYDLILKQTIAGKGDAWFRYNYDGYGERNDGRGYDGGGRGRLWPIFTAERGIYEIAMSRTGTDGQPYLSALKSFSSAAGLIPEQIWNNSGTITGWVTTTPSGHEPGTATLSMSPLNWAMGEYINLTAAINHSTHDAPSIVCERYSCDQPQVKVTFKVNAETQWGESVYLVGNDPVLSQWRPTSSIKLLPNSYPIWSTTVSLPASKNFEYKFIKINHGGSIVWETGGNRVLTTPSNGEVIQENGNFQ